MTDYSALIAELRGRYKDTKQMLPCELEHRAADAIEALISRIQGQAEPVGEVKDKPANEFGNLTWPRVVWKDGLFAMPPVGTKLYASPPAAHAPSDAVKELYEECFQHVFKIYSTPRDKFNDDEQWALFCYRQVYDNLEKFQRLRAALAKYGTQAATPSPSEPGQWVRCTPELLKAGVCCDKTPRRAGDGTYSHDHWVSHAPSPSDLTAYGEKVREAAAKLFWPRPDGCEFADGYLIQSAMAIRSMPLPAQSEGEEK